MRLRRKRKPVDPRALVELARVVASEHREWLAAVRAERTAEQRLFRAKSAAWFRNRP
jgi:hypothetical protein